jgi:hypothetical protein
MANLGTLALGIWTNVISTSQSGTPPILEIIALANDGDYVIDNTNSTHVSLCTFTLDDMPADFKFMQTVSIRVRYVCAAAMTNTWNAITARLLKSDGVTALSDSVTVVTGPITTTTATNSAVVAFTNVDTDATLADWNGALVELSYNITRNKSGDSISKRITAAEITGTYTIDTSVNISEAVTVTEDITVKVARLVIEEVFETVTVDDSVAYNLTQLPLTISADELVIVQEGQETLPKANVFDTVTLVESVTLMVPLAPTAFDLILTQDSPAVQPVFFSLAIVVFDNVLVQEGQEESNAVRPAVIDTVTVAESVSLVFNLLRMTVSDVVTVVDAIGVDAQGPLGMVVFDSVLVQEFIRPYVSVYINCFDEVSVDDGSRLVEEFDAVTVTEDITVKLARLVLDVFEDVAVTESAAADGLTLELLNGVSIEDIIMAEDVTVLLAQIRVGQPLTYILDESGEPILDEEGNPIEEESSDTVVNSDVMVADACTVFVSSIDLTVDVSDEVTALDVVETIQLTPILVEEFTEVTVTEDAQAITSLLLIDVFDAVTVAEDATMTFQLLQIGVNDAVSVTERVAMRITRPGQSRRHQLPVVGVE